MRICITRSARYAYSETFIRDQIATFSKYAETFPIHSGRFPERTEDGSLIYPKLFWIMHKLTKVVLGRNNPFSNYGMKTYLKKNRIEVVLANYGLTASHMVSLCKSLNIPLLVIFHGHDASNQKLLVKYKKKYKSLFAYATTIIAVSNAMKKSLVKLGAKPEKIQVVPCGVDINIFKPRPDQTKQQNFLAVGRFVPKKGPLYTLEAFNYVLKKFPKARLTMVGKKHGMHEECKLRAEQLGISNAVSFPGILGQTEIIERMNKSIAFVQHSLTAPNGDMEGSPVSIMEASACGLPVVSTLHGGIPDIVIHNKTGFLVKEADIETMAEFMIRILEDHEKASAMGIAGRENVSKNYNQEKQLGKLYQLCVQAKN